VPGSSGTFYLQKQLAPLVDGRISEFITDLAIPAEPGAALRLALRRGHPILGRRFDLIVDTQRYLARTLFLRRIPHRRFISGTWRYVWSDAAPPPPLSRRPPVLVDKLLGLAAAAAGREIRVSNPVPIPAALRARAAALLPPGPVYVGVSPGAGNKASGRCWPLEGFIQVAQRQAAAGRVPVFLVGPEETQWLGRLREAVPEALFPEQRNAEIGDDIRGPSVTAALGERLTAALANCSGTGHLLAAGGAPMVSLYGPTRPEKYAPFSRALIWLKAQDYGSDRIDAIPLDAVAAAVERQVTQGPGAAAHPDATKGKAYVVTGADLGR